MRRDQGYRFFGNRRNVDVAKSDIRIFVQNVRASLRYLKNNLNDTSQLSTPVEKILSCCEQQGDGNLSALREHRQKCGQQFASQDVGISHTTLRQNIELCIRVTEEKFDTLKQLIQSDRNAAEQRVPQDVREITRQIDTSILELDQILEQLKQRDDHGQAFHPEILYQ